jgi:hypothetical protein
MQTKPLALAKGFGNQDWAPNQSFGGVLFAGSEFMFALLAGCCWGVDCCDVE